MDFPKKSEDFGQLFLVRFFFLNHPNLLECFLSVFFNECFFEIPNCHSFFLVFFNDVTRIPRDEIGRYSVRNQRQLSHHDAVGGQTKFKVHHFGREAKARANAQ